MTANHVYKILPKAMYDEAIAADIFKGSTLDLKDGYIHLSTPAQVRQTASLHFAGQKDLMIIALDAASLGQAIKWEPSRGGQLFPHYYGNLSPSNFLWAKPLPWNGSAHDFPMEVLS